MRGLNGCFLFLVILILIPISIYLRSWSRPRCVSGSLGGGVGTKLTDPNVTFSNCTDMRFILPRFILAPLGCLLVFSAVVAAQDNAPEDPRPAADDATDRMVGDGRQWLTFEGDRSLPGGGKHIVLVSGDHEYRSEEALPQLGKILAVRHGFKCTVLFAIDPATGEIDPDYDSNIPGLDVLQDADLVIFGLRFRNLPDEQMEKILAYAESGKPMISLRTSTHPFAIPADRQYHRQSWDYKKETDDPDAGGFGQRVFGETWIKHHGHHKYESTRGVVADPDHPIATGIGEGDIWGPTDVYYVTLPLRGDGHAVINGQVLTGMDPDDPPLAEKNDPMMPIGWTRTYKGGRVFVTTMGSADDLPSEGVRRMIVNAAYWCLSMEDKITADANVDLVGDYNPTGFGFDGAVKGRRPAFYDLEASAK